MDQKSKKESNKKKPISKKLEKKILEIAEGVDMEVKIDKWDGEEIRVWTDHSEIVNFIPLKDDKVNVKTLVEFNITTLSKKKADKMYDEATEVFDGSDCDVRFDDYGKTDQKVIAINCKGDRIIDLSDFDEEKDNIIRQVNELMHDTRNENREYVRQVRDVDESSEVDYLGE